MEYYAAVMEGSSPFHKKLLVKKKQDSEEAYHAT
jgi:hypothetical protein